MGVPQHVLPPFPTQKRGRSNEFIIPRFNVLITSSLIIYNKSNNINTIFIYLETIQDECDLFYYHPLMPWSQMSNLVKILHPMKMDYSCCLVGA